MRKFNMAVHHNLSCLILGFVALFAFSTRASAQTLYHLQSVGAFPGGTSSFAYAMNASGQVVGEASDTSGNGHAFLYDNGQMQDLGVLGDPSQSYSIPLAVNDSDEVVGEAATVGQFEQAFLYSNGQMQDLFSGVAYGINDSGQIVGTLLNGHGFMYNGQMNDLGTMGGSYSDALAINSSGLIAGDFYLSGNTSLHACLFANGQIQDLGTLGGASSIAYALNDAGEAAGWSVTASGANDAFLYSNGQLQDLGSLFGNYTEALGVNDSGQVVGDSWNAHNIPTAFIYESGVMYNLNNLLDSSGQGWKLDYAMAINGSGQIACNGVNTSGGYAVILTPDLPPVISSVSPDRVSSGGSDFVLTVNGSNLFGGSTVYWGSTPLTTSFVSINQATAIVPAALIAKHGEAKITIVTPVGTSNDRKVHY